MTTVVFQTPTYDPPAGALHHLPATSPIWSKTLETPPLYCTHSVRFYLCTRVFTSHFVDRLCNFLTAHFRVLTLGH